MEKEQRKPRHALLFAGDGTLYNPPAPRARSRRSSLSRFPLLDPSSLSSHRRPITGEIGRRIQKGPVFGRISSRSMDFSRIEEGAGRRLGFCNTASFSFASLLGALHLLRIWEFLKGRGMKVEMPAGKTMATMVARQGRQFQRYTSSGGRLVVGCIPYKLKTDDSCKEGIDKLVQVLVISSQKGQGMMFPKGGWESDETMKQAASREALEEAGVHGHVESCLGNWMYKSNRYDVFYEGIAFPLNVTEELPYWPEMGVRKRRWVTVAEAREGCQHWWMREALERLLTRLGNQHSDS